MTVAETQLLLRSTTADWNYERWQTLPDDGNLYEVIDGVLYMSTSPSLFHQWIVNQLVTLIGVPLRSQQEAYWFTAPTGVLMPGCDPAQPGFTLIRHGRKEPLVGKKINGAPDLVVEVLSPSNVEHDTQIKLGAYARAGVPEYWIVRPMSRDLLIHTRPDAIRGAFGDIRLLHEHDELISETLPINIPIAALFMDSPNTLL